MKILALEKETPNTTPEQFTPHLKAEVARVKVVFPQECTGSWEILPRLWTECVLH